MSIGIHLLSGIDQSIHGVDSLDFLVRRAPDVWITHCPHLPSVKSHNFQHIISLGCVKPSKAYQILQMNIHKVHQFCCGGAPGHQASDPLNGAVEQFFTRLGRLKSLHASTLVFWNVHFCCHSCLLTPSLFCWPTFFLCESHLLRKSVLFCRLPSVLYSLSLIG